VAAGVSQLTRGQRLLLEDDLQLHAASYAEANGGYVNQQAWRDSGFSIEMGLPGGYSPASYGAPGEFRWSLTEWTGAKGLRPEAQGYLPYLTAWQYGDEQDLSNAATRAAAASWFADMHARPEYDHVLFFMNQTAPQHTEAEMRAFVSEIKPDMVVYDSYTWGFENPLQYANGSPTQMYQNLGKYRRIGLAGLDGTGAKPLPYGRYEQGIVYLRQFPGIRTSYHMSESEIRLEQFSSLAFGYKFTSVFTFDSPTLFDPNVGVSLFDGAGATAQPTPRYDYWRETNRQARNLGSTLAALLSKDVRMVTGPRSNTTHGIAEFDQTADPYMKSVTATNPGTLNDGQRGDVLVGLFTPVSEDLDGPAYGDQTYFMIVNGLSWENASASATEQMIRIAFDFGDSGITGVLRKNRYTGLVESVPLIPDGGSQYHLDLVLGGGEGDLFKYDTGAPFVEVPEPGEVGLVGVLVAAAAALRRRRRPGL
jgi:MYXO-CTERM domain-containing protein